MAQKTFCDKCGSEIPRKKLHLVKHEIVLTRVDEDQLGNLDSDDTLRAELCAGCRAQIGVIVTRFLKR